MSILISNFFSYINTAVTSIKASTYPFLSSSLYAELIITVLLLGSIISLFFIGVSHYER